MRENLYRGNVIEKRRRMSAVMKSISPKECERIVIGEQTILVSKTRPKIDTPFKCYIIYRTTEKVTEIIEEYDSNFKLLRCKKTLRKFSGKVIGEFVCDRIDKFESEFWDDDTYERIKIFYETDDSDIDPEYCYYTIGEDGEFYRNFSFDKKSCITWGELRKYIGQGIKIFYGLHISDLKIYDKSKELGEFYKPLKYDEDGVICGTKQEMSNIYEWDCETVFNKKYTECTLKDCPQLQKFYRLNRPPQSWCYVEEL